MTMTLIDLLGEDIRSRAVADFLESRNAQVELEVIEDRAYILADHQGLSIMAGPNYKVDTLHFYAEGVQGCSQFQGELPLQLRFGQSCSEIRQQLGQPARTGGGNTNARGEKIAFWDRYNLPVCCLHLQYRSSDDCLELVTLMSHETVP